MPRLPTNPRELDVFCSDRAIAAATGDGAILCRILGCKPFYVSSQDRWMNPHLVIGGVWESPLTCFLTRLVPPGWKWADVGANVGYYSVLLSELSPDGYGIAYEPDPIAFDLLKTNVRINGCRNVHCVRAGVGAVYRHSFTFHLSTDNIGGASVHKSPYVEDAADEFSAEVLTLASPHEFDIVKIDAEGEDLPIVLSWPTMPKHTVIEYAGKFKHVPDLLPALFDKCHVQLLDEEGNARETTIDEVRPLDVATLYLQPR